MKCTLFILQTAIHVVCLRQKKNAYETQKFDLGKMTVKVLV